MLRVGLPPDPAVLAEVEAKVKELQSKMALQAEKRERRFQALTRHIPRRRSDPEPPPKALALSA